MASFYALLFFSFTIFFHLSTNNPFVDCKGGFTVDLIHRDSPKSPYYNPSDTLFDRVSKAIHRSTSRANYLRSSLKPSSSVSPTTIRSKITPNNGNYLMELSFGTPAVKTLAIADTGSDLIWIQCKPCDNCFQQDAPLFDPADSSTYRDLSCQSNPCQALPQASCSGSKCQYSYSYGDQSFTDGVLATETLTFGSINSNRSTVQIPKISFGCGHNNGGTFDSHESGLVGLGGGPLSLISQLGSSIDGKFSYCLAPFGQSASSSQLNFGDRATVSGPDVVSTSLIPKEPDTFFYVNLETITVGNKKVQVSSSEEGNIIIDSGTTLTYLETSAFNELVSVLKDAIQLTPAQDPSGTLELCYEASEDAEIPSLNFGFTGAELVLPSLNTFIQVSDGVICLAMVGSDSLAILGNIAQTNFKVGYDLGGKKVSFSPTDCTKN